MIDSPMMSNSHEVLVGLEDDVDDENMDFIATSSQ
jgi:hypothetical protein